MSDTAPLSHLLPPPGPPPGLSLVLGAGGFLGGHVASWLARSGARARLFDLSVESIPGAVRRAPGVEVVHGNLMDDAVLRRALEGVDRVFHFVSATVPATSIDDVALELRANVEPMNRLLEAMREAGVGLLVFPSSGGTLYGDDAPERGSPEDAPLSPRGTYGLGKRLIEEILRFRSRAGGPHHLVVRIANAYGPTVHSHHRQGVINAFLERVREGQPVRIWGDGSAVRDFVHTDDLVAAVAALVAAGVRDEVFNLGAGEGVSIRELIDLISGVVGRPVALEPMPGAYAGVRRNVLDVTRLRERVGWRPQVTLRDGIAHLWRSMTR